MKQTENWEFYDGGAVKPRGWLKRQLEIQAEGLSGHLHEVWKDVRDSAWIGGDAEGWERVPYWLDGFIPLAFLLEDEEKQSIAKKYIDAILLSQRKDGWICPCRVREIPTYDTWAVQLLSKTLLVYYRYTRDERIPTALYDMMKNYYTLLENGTIRLFDWGKYRWYEAFFALDFLYETYKEEWIKDLARILKNQGADYKGFTEQWKRPLYLWTFETHVVNLAMMLKSEAVSCVLLGEPYTDLASDLLSVLDEYNGLPAGIFSGDECLAGRGPIQGTELCAVVEMMFSMEQLYARTGDAKWAERLEKLAFNALPATCSDDMWAHQYDQMPNQINCIRFPRQGPFTTNGQESHLFGLEPNYGCCTANFSQGWPKFAQSVFLHKGGSVLCALPVPALLDTDGIRVEIITAYPFKNEILYRVAAEKDITMLIRVPSFAENLRVNGRAAESTDRLSFDIAAGESREIRVTFETRAVMQSYPHNMATVQCGSLVYALPIQYEKRILEYERKGVDRKFPYCDYEYIGKSEWRYGLVSVDETPETKTLPDVPFSSDQPPLTLNATLRRIPWDYEFGFDTVCEKYPENREPVGPEETIQLTPYGCAKLRITVFPDLKDMD